MPLTSLEKGRRSEREVVRKLNDWAGGLWRFGRRGLGHAGVADVVAIAQPSSGVSWPFVISVKAGRGPSLRTLLERADAGRWWRWWEEVVRAAREPELAWLIWKSDGAWLLSCWALWGASVPPCVVVVLPDPSPRFTMLFDAFLARVRPEHIARVIVEPTFAEFVERGRRAQEAVDRLTGGL